MQETPLGVGDGLGSKWFIPLAFLWLKVVAKCSVIKLLLRFKMPYDYHWSYSRCTVMGICPLDSKALNLSLSHTHPCAEGIEFVPCAAKS